MIKSNKLNLKNMFNIKSLKLIATLITFSSLTACVSTNYYDSYDNNHRPIIHNKSNCSSFYNNCNRPIINNHYKKDTRNNIKPIYNPPSHNQIQKPSIRPNVPTRPNVPAPNKNIHNQQSMNNKPVGKIVNSPQNRPNNNMQKPDNRQTRPLSRETPQNQKKIEHDNMKSSHQRR